MLSDETDKFVELCKQNAKKEFEKYHRLYFGSELLYMTKSKEEMEQTIKSGFHPDGNDGIGKIYRRIPEGSHVIPAKGE